MRGQIAFVALLMLGACQQPSEQAASPAPTNSAAENVIEGRAWNVRDGQIQGNVVALQPGSLAFVQNPRAPVSGEDSYTGEMLINAESPATVTIRISNGCGTTENDQGFADYTLQPGENTLRVHHTFVRPARCARLSLSSRQPLSYQLSNARLTKN